jgi:hypothetical protein
MEIYGKTPPYKVRIKTPINASKTEKFWNFVSFSLKNRTPIKDIHKGVYEIP